MNKFSGKSMAYPLTAESDCFKHSRNETNW